MIIVLARAEIDPEHLEPMREAARAMVAASRAEPGCREYVFSEELDAPGTLRVVERWASMEALESHFEEPHMARFQQALRDHPPRSLEIEVFELGAARTLPRPGR
jgi:quinol monooxygenase YgiN